MANDENLIPMNRRTKSEQRKIATAGGKASGAARRKKRDMRKAAEMLLNMPVSNKQSTMKATLTALGIDEEDMDYSMGVMAAMLVQAANGNVNAAKFLRDTAGQNPTQQLQEKEFAYRKKQDREAKKAEEDGGMTGGTPVEIYLPEKEGEDDVWEYWKRASGMAEKMQQYKTYPQIRTFAIENHTSPQIVRLRSAYRGDSDGTWCVYSDGYVFYYGYASWAYRCAPACWLC